MEIYRQDGQRDEAGRWGYLLRDGATRDERAAYEHACKHRLHAHWQGTYLRNGLHWPDGLEAADPWVSAILKELDMRAARESETWHVRRARPSAWARFVEAFRRV